MNAFKWMNDKKEHLWSIDLHGFDADERHKYHEYQNWISFCHLSFFSVPHQSFIFTEREGSAHEWFKWDISHLWDCTLSPSRRMLWYIVQILHYSKHDPFHCLRPTLKVSIVFLAVFTRHLKVFQLDGERGKCIQRDLIPILESCAAAHNSEISCLI